MIGHGSKWEEALLDLMDTIMSYDFKNVISLIKIDFLGNYSSQNIKQNEKGDYYIKPSKNINT